MHLLVMTNCFQRDLFIKASSSFTLRSPMTSKNTLEADINDLKKYIKNFPDFPKPGILYK